MNSASLSDIEWFTYTDLNLGFLRIHPIDSEKMDRTSNVFKKKIKF